MRLAVALVLVLSTSALVAQQAALPTAFTAVVRGRVFDAGTGVPLARAAVTLYNTYPAGGRVLTDDRGQFELPVVALPVSLRISKAGHAVSVVGVAREDAGLVLNVTLPRAAAITGRVTDDAGQPLGGTTVRARRVSAGDNAPAQHVGTADDRGEYRIGGLAEGTYEVSVTAVGVTAEQVLQEANGASVVIGAAEMNDRLARLNTLLQQGAPADAATRSAVRTVMVAQGAEIGAIDLVTTPSRPASCGFNGNASQGDPARRGRIRGRITGELGQPLRCATVELLQPGVSRVSFLSSTDATGIYEFTGVATGSFVVAARGNGYSVRRYGQRQNVAQGTSIDLRDGAAIAGIDISLSRLPTISGMVVDERGEPIEGVRIQPMLLRNIGDTATASPPSGAGGGVTNDRGEFRLHGLPTGTFVLAASVNGAVTSIEGGTSRGYATVYFPGTSDIAVAQPVTLENADVQGLTLQLSRTPTARVTGLALDRTGRPFGATVSLGISRRSGAIVVPPRQITAAPDGTFVFDDVPSGEYVIQAYARSPVQFAMQYLAVGNEAVPPIILTATAGPVVEGRLVVEGLTDAEVEALPVSVSGMAVDVDRAPPLGSGAVRVGPVEQGVRPFRLMNAFGPRRLSLVTGLREGWFVRSATVNGSDALDAPFDFGLAETEFRNVEVVISPNGALVEGKAVDGRQRSIVDFAVILFSAHREHWFQNSQRLKLMSSRQDGSFRFHSLPAGDYYLVALDRVDGNVADGGWQDPAFLLELMSVSQRITLAEGERLTTTARLISR